jgi:SAM-dependent methyltransferase
VRIKTTIDVYSVGLCRRAYRFLAQHGVVKTAFLCLKYALVCAQRHLLRRSGSQGLHQSINADFDRRFNVDTGQGPGELLNLATVSTPNWRHGIKYEPVNEDIFRQLLDSLAIRHEGFTFIDFGSGKGKALLLAANYPFRKIIGVEYSRHLHQVATRNILSYASPARRCHKIESVCEDAARFSIPHEACVFFFFNPFTRPIMEVVAGNILSSVTLFPRQVFLLYYHAVHADILRQAFQEKTKWSIGGLTHILFQGP